MNIQRVGIERTDRIDKAKNDGPQTKVAKFGSYKIKQWIFNNASSLKGKDYFINKVYSKEKAAIRKEKWKEVKQLWEQGNMQSFFMIGWCGEIKVESFSLFFTVGYLIF